MPVAYFPGETRAKVARWRQENPLGMSVQLRLVSTLALVAAAAAPPAASARDRAGDGLLFRVSGDKTLLADERSEERRVGKECVSTCRSRGAPDTSKQQSLTITQTQLNVSINSVEQFH